MEYLKSGNIFEFVAINERANGGHGRLVRQVDRVPTGSDGAFQSPPQMKHFARIRKGCFQNVAIGNTRGFSDSSIVPRLLATNRVNVINHRDVNTCKEGNSWA